MAAYDYRCESDSCGVVQELVQSIHTPLPESLSCPRCGGLSFHVFLVAPSLSSANLGHKTIDQAVGLDAEKRWDRIHERQAVRDKVRKESGEQALKATGLGRYEPLKGARLEAVRTPEPAS
jgi:putative FmdB family regulatory protein